VAFQFTKANCVAVGTFNMYIIQPAWLAKVGIIPKGIGVAIESKLDEPGFRFWSPKLPVRWLVTPNRIEVETQRADADCGKAVAGIVEHLPWTPLIALGNNAIYQAPFDDLEAIPIPASLWREGPEGFKTVQKTLHYGMGRDDTTFHIQLAISEKNLELSVNAHTELKELKPEDAAKVAGRFFEDRQTGERLIKHLFQVSVVYAQPDANDAESDIQPVDLSQKAVGGT
jgi:hypothetical protein